MESTEPFGSPVNDNFSSACVPTYLLLGGSPPDPAIYVMHFAVYPTALSASDVLANYNAACGRQDGDCFAATRAPRHQAYVIT